MKATIALIAFFGLPAALGAIIQDSEDTSLDCRDPLAIPHCHHESIPAPEEPEEDEEVVFHLQPRNPQRQPSASTSSIPTSLITSSAPATGSVTSSAAASISASSLPSISEVPLPSVSASVSGASASSTSLSASPATGGGRNPLSNTPSMSASSSSSSSGNWAAMPTAGGMVVMGVGAVVGAAVF